MTILLWYIGVVVYLVIGGMGAAFADITDEMAMVGFACVWPLFIVVFVLYLVVRLGADLFDFIEERLTNGRR